MRYFIDTEFVEDGKTIDLISIGIVAEDGRTYYAISTEFDLQKAEAHPFVSEHVLPHIIGPAVGEFLRTRKQIAEEIWNFVYEAKSAPEFWGDYAAYDWVAFCQLFGEMNGLPGGWPYFCNDVQQFRKLLNIGSIPPNEILMLREHHALDDARECYLRWAMLNRVWEQMKADL